MTVVAPCLNSVYYDRLHYRLWLWLLALDSRHIGSSVRRFPQDFDDVERPIFLLWHQCLEF